MSTLREVAKEVGVSVATVSYVLNKKGSVSEEVAKQVMAAVKKLNYRPNRRAQAMRTGYSQAIGLVLPDLTNPYFPELAQKVANEARKHGLAVILIDSQNTTEAESQGLSILAQHGVDGIIWCPVKDISSQHKVDIKCPVVLVDRPAKGFDAVHANYKMGGNLVAEHVIALGHKKVGMLSGPSNIESAVQRRNGFLEKAQGKLEILWDIEVPFSTELNDEAVAALKKKNVSVIVAAADLIAIGAINALNDANISVPNDVSMIGFDDIPWSSLMRPKLTTISQPIADIGKAALDILLQRIQTPEKTTCSFVLDVVLVERDSAIAHA